MPQWLEGLDAMNREKLQEEVKNACSRAYAFEEEARVRSLENQSLRQIIADLRKEICSLHNAPLGRLAKALDILCHPRKFKQKNLLSRLWQRAVYKKPLMPEYNLLAPLEQALLHIQKIPETDTVLRTAPPIVFAGEIFIFAVVPMDDIGGGQRSAQLTRCLLNRMYKVHYIYRFPKVEDQLPTANEFFTNQLTHRFFPNTPQPEELFRNVSPNAQVIFEFPHPDYIPYLQKAQELGLKCIYDLIDPWNTQLGDHWYDREKEQIFIKSCQKITATAGVLQEYIKKCGREDVIYVPNAADSRFFNLYTSPGCPADLPQGYSKIILYIGSMYGVWFHWRALQLAAEKNPQSAFFMIGSPPDFPITVPPNVIFAGLRENVELPGYIAHADAVIIPFCPGKLVDAVSPIKVFEYLFAGCPVISLKMPELDGYPGVFQAESPAEFADLCSLEKIHPPTLEEREAFAARNTWEHRLDVLLDLPPLRNSYSMIIVTETDTPALESLLDAFLFHCANLPVEIIVVTNASTDNKSVTANNKYAEKVKLVRCSENNTTAYRNIGAAHAANDILIFWDLLDGLTSTAWLWEYEFLSGNHPDVGAFSRSAGFFVNNHLRREILDSYTPSATVTDEYFSKGFRTDIHYLETSGLILSRALFNRVGGFDPGYASSSLDGPDLSMKIRQAGFRIAYRDFSGIMQSHPPFKTAQEQDFFNHWNSRFHDFFK